MIIYHITSRTAWEAAQAASEYSPDSLKTEGFIHASTGEQVADTANRFYHGQKGLVLLQIDTDRLIPRVRFDPVVESGKEKQFPHIYGALNPDAVIQVITFEPDERGSFSLPADLAHEL